MSPSTEDQSSERVRKAQAQRPAPVTTVTTLSSRLYVGCLYVKVQERLSKRMARHALVEPQLPSPAKNRHLVTEMASFL